ncbi:MAG: deoxyribonuclease V [Caldilineaceae bacterium]|nr:deoxyribonuclease V [Caldilineaceae bacterium]
MQLTLHHPHPWDVSPTEAVAIQRELAPKVREEALSRPIETVAGIDMSVREDRVQAAVVVLRLPKLERIDTAIWRGPVEFPYISGLLSFREVPAVLRALAQLRIVPDLLMTDSQGKAHPRRLGLASHLGVLLDIPAIGVAKTRLIGDPAGELPVEQGSYVPLLDHGDVVGALLRTRARVNPVYVSIGHRITLPEAIALTLSCTQGYKLPEPTRQAHLLSRGELG